MRLHWRGKETALQGRTSSWQPIGVSSGTKTELRKSAKWHEVHVMDYFPASAPVQSRFKALSLGYFCDGAPRGKLSFVSLLGVFLPMIPAGEASRHLCCLFHWPFWESRALSSGGPNHDGPGEQWSTRPGNMRIRAETHFSISCACRGTTIVFMVRISSSLVSV